MSCREESDALFGKGHQTFHHLPLVPLSILSTLVEHLIPYTVHRFFVQVLGANTIMVNYLARVRTIRLRKRMVIQQYLKKKKKVITESDRILILRHNSRLSSS